MADLSITFCGYTLQSPFIVSSGPLSYGAEGMIQAHKAGSGAVVTKTIRSTPADNPIHHMGTVGKDSLINSEKWADIDKEQWFSKEIPEAVAAGVVVIASVGHTLEEAQEIVESVEKAGAHMIELVSYEEDTLIPMLDYTKKRVNIPVICKLSGNWPDPVGTARTCLAHGADGICAVDSLGPVLEIDIEQARPKMMTPNGYGWLTGAAMRPISLRINSEIAREHPEFTNLYGSGGVMNADNAIEYAMVGATGIGVCTAGILHGVGYIETLCTNLSKRLDKLGYPSIGAAYRAALPNFLEQEYMGTLEFTFTPFRADGTKYCIGCKKCVTVCCYRARVLDFPKMHVDMNKCRSCGLCVDVCPVRALKATPANAAVAPPVSGGVATCGNKHN